MSTKIMIIGLMVCTLGLGAWALWAASGDATTETAVTESDPEPAQPIQPLLDYRVQILEVKQVATKSLTLSPSHFLITRSDGRSEKVSVLMEKQPYELKGRIAEEETVTEWSGTAWCYEFRCEDPEA